MEIKKYLNVAWKIAILAIVAFICLGRMITNGLDTYKDSREFELYNFGSGEGDLSIALNTDVEQIIVARGDELRELGLYLSGVDNQSNDFVNITIKDGNGHIYSHKAYAVSDCVNDDFNKFPINVSGLKVNGSYIVQISSDDDNICCILKMSEFDTEYFGVFSDGETSYSGALNCGVKYCYNYLTAGSVFQIIADYAIVLMLLVLLGYALYNCEKLYGEINEGSAKKGILPAVCGSILLFFTINPISKNVTELKEYSRNIGVGIMELYDITRVIRNFNLCFIVVIISSVLLYLLFHKCESDIEKCDSTIAGFIDNLNVLYLVNLCMRGLVFYQLTDLKTFHYTGYIFIQIYVCTYVYAKTSVGSRVSKEIYVQYLITAATLGMGLSACLTKEWRDGRFMLGVQCLLILVVLLYIRYAKNIINIGLFSVFTAWMPLMLSVYAEFVIILNQRGIFVSSPKEYYVALTIIYITVAALVTYMKRKQLSDAIRLKRVAYPGIILGMSAMAVQPLINNTYTVDFIESSNASILISDFLNFGSIPVVEHYGGHMMTAVWEGIAYGLLTGDRLGAMFSPYSGYLILIIAILFYWLMKNIINEDVALLTVLLIPFYGMTEYFGLGLLIAVALVAYDRKQSLINGFLIWLAFGWVTLYRLDMGFSYLWGIGLVLISGVILKKEIGYLKNAAISLVVTGTAALGVWFAVCSLKGISPLVRLKEFLLLSASNQTWAYGGLGDSSVTAFPVMYLFLPVLMAVLLVYALMSKSFRTSTKNEIWMILVYLGGAYFGNYSRTVVRHSVYEMKIHILVWSALLFIAMFVAVKFRNSKLVIPVYVFLFVSMMVLKSEGVYNEQPVINRASANITSMVDSWSINRFNKNNPNSMTIWEQSAATGEPIARIYIDEEVNNRIIGYGNLINGLLNDNETFVECMDRTFLYSALGRKNPLYVSQSPIQISGEFSQEQYIAEIEAAKDYCPILLLPVDGQNYRASSFLEGTPHAYKYYKVFEYFYDKFTPLCAYDDVAVWCRNEAYESMLSKTAGIEGVQLISWGYDGPVMDEAGLVQYQAFLHNYDLKELANAWANLDIKNAAANEIISKGLRSDIVYQFELSEADYEKPAYLGINLQSMADKSNVTIIMGDMSQGTFVQKCKYTLDISDDINYYMVRLSSDYYWHLGEINSMMVVSDDKVYADSAKIIMGD